MKPNAEDSSFGVSKVKHADEFDAAMTEAFSKYREVLIETFIDSTEFTYPRSVFDEAINDKIEK